MMKKYFAIFTLLSVSLSAQILTMQSCIDKALQTHPDIKSFVLEVSKNEQNYISTRSAYLPHITLQAEYDFERTYVLPQNGQFNTINQKGQQVGVIASQKIWDFGKTGASIDVAELQSQISQLGVEEAKKLMVYKVQELYTSVLVFKELINVRKKDMQTKKELYKQALAFVEEGLKTNSDATRFLSSYYLAKDLHGVAEASYEKALSSLSLYTSQSITSSSQLQNNLDIEINQDTKNLQTLTQELNENNTQLKIYNKNIEKNQVFYKGANAAHYGSIDAIASYNYFDTLNTYDTSLLGVTLNIPIYTGSDMSAQTQMAKISTNITRELKASKQLALQEELSALVIDLKSYKNTIAAKKAQLEASLSTKELLNARYQEGLATYIEVLDATSLYLEAKLGLLQAYFSKTMAQNRIIYLTGNQL